VLQNLMLLGSVWRFFQSGMYFDFVYKKMAMSLVFNVLIYTSQFFGEKFLIEFITKKCLSSSIFFFNYN